jgi:hypothetical protein
LLGRQRSHRGFRALPLRRRALSGGELNGK